MESLGMKKVHIDTRFKTADSKGDTDFAVETPKTFNLPDDIKIIIAKNMGYTIPINRRIIQNVY